MSAKENKQFADYAKDIKRLRYCSRLMKHYKIHPSYGRQVFMKMPADDTEASMQLILGEKCWKQEDVRNAMIHINRSVVQSLTKYASAKAFVTRSKIYYQLRQYRQCVESLDLARETHDLYVDSDSIQSECAAELSREDDEEQTLLSQFRSTEFNATLRLDFDGAPRQNESTFGDKLEWVADPDTAHGQAVFSRQTFGVGQVIAIDRSLVSTLTGDAALMRCSLCHREELFALRPCDTPKCMAMWCSAECEKRAMYMGHGYECGVGRFLHTFEECRQIVRLVVNTFRTEADVEDWLDFVEQTSKEDMSRENNVIAFARKVPLPRNYKAKMAYALAQHTRTLSTMEHFHYSRVATVVYQLLKHQTFLVYDLFEHFSQRKPLRRFIYYNLLMLVEHARRVSASSSVRLTDERQDQHEFAVGLYPLSATIAHSCTPNVAVYTCSMHQVALIAVRPIRPGDQLSIDKTYGADDGRASEHKRRQRMFRGEDCSCSEVPTEMPFPNAESPKRLTDELLWSDHSVEMRHLFAKSSPEVQAEFRRICDFMTANAELLPSWEMHVTRRCFDLCVERLVGPPILHDLAKDSFAQKRIREERRYMRDEYKRRKADEARVAEENAPPKTPPEKNESEELQLFEEPAVQGAYGVDLSLSLDDAEALAVLEPRRFMFGEAVARSDSQATMFSVESLPTCMKFDDTAPERQIPDNGVEIYTTDESDDDSE